MLTLLQLVQVFDSWAAELSPAAFREFSQPYLAYISAHLPGKLKEMKLEPVPMVVFAKGAWYALDSLCDLGYQVVGLDWLQDPADAVKIRGDRKIVFQGNADPGILYGTSENITSTVATMVEGFGGGKQGWIANLGHGKLGMTLCAPNNADHNLGITPGVKPDALKFYFSEIHRLTSK